MKTILFPATAGGIDVSSKTILSRFSLSLSLFVGIFALLLCRRLCFYEAVAQCSYILLITNRSPVGLRFGALGGTGAKLKTRDNENKKKTEGKERKLKTHVSQNNHHQGVKTAAKRQHTVQRCGR